MLHKQGKSGKVETHKYFYTSLSPTKVIQSCDNVLFHHSFPFELFDIHPHAFRGNYRKEHSGVLRPVIIFSKFDRQSSC